MTRLLPALLLAACWVGPAESPPVTPLPQPQPAPVVVTTPAPQPVAAPLTPFAPGQVWVGRYLCAQGTTELAVQVTAVVGTTLEGSFTFQHAPSGAAGQYLLAGTYDPATRLVEVVPGAWIDQPAGYVTVGMRCTVSPDGSTWSGSITNPSCGTFIVQRSN